MNIKNLVEKKIWLAPLAGLTDYPFRQICKKNGADVLVSEMISADGLIYNFKKSMQYAVFSDFMRPWGIQLFGVNPDIMARSVEKIMHLNPDFVDINMGCPVRKVVKRGAGSALMKTPILAAEIVYKIRKRLPNTPLSAKIRAGWDLSSQNAVQFAKILEENGLDFIIIHPRTRSEMFSGKSNWEIISELKEDIKIPVVANGDILSKQDATDIYSKTKCDSIMIGRGALGKPWIFDEIKNKDFCITKEKKLEILEAHLNLVIKKEQDEKKVMIKMRTHLSHYTKGYKNGSLARQKINKSIKKEEILEIFKELWID